eukprot:6475612-Amphidinium_carterae.1
MKTIGKNTLTIHLQVTKTESTNLLKGEDWHASPIPSPSIANTHMRTLGHREIVGPRPVTHGLPRQFAAIPGHGYNTGSSSRVLACETLGAWIKNTCQRRHVMMGHRKQV